jgi:hypothetical protein
MRLSNYDGFLAYFAGRVFIAEETPGFEELKHELVRTRPTATDFVLEDQSSP